MAFDIREAYEDKRERKRKNNNTRSWTKSSLVIIPRKTGSLVRATEGLDDLPMVCHLSFVDVIHHWYLSVIVYATNHLWWDHCSDLAHERSLNYWFDVWTMFCLLYQGEDSIQNDCQQATTSHWCWNEVQHYVVERRLMIVVAWNYLSSDRDQSTRKCVVLTREVIENRPVLHRVHHHWYSHWYCSHDPTRTNVNSLSDRDHILRLKNKSGAVSLWSMNNCQL